MHARATATGLFAALLFLPLLAPAPLRAQEERIDTPYRWIDRSLRVTPFAGYVFADRGGLDQGPGSSAIFGARLRARLSSPLTFELEGGLGSSERYVVDPRLETGPAIVDEANVDWLLVQAGFQLALTGARSYHRIQPYVMVLGGVLQGLGEETPEAFRDFGLERFRFRIGTTPAFTLGFGAEWDVSDRIGLGLEVRDRIWRVTTPDGWFDQNILERIEELGVEAPQESYWTNNIELGAGISYYF
ncbi:MAG: hypothetical protein RRA92_08950 [Gemmatimonadota bacterium]|nr:hypothetical protein [Gemmatimonadota bacterium]